MYDGMTREELISELELTRGKLKAYREREGCFRAIFENSVVGIVIMTLDMGICDTNPALENMLGFTSEEFKTLNLWDICFPEDYESDRELLLDVLEGRRQYYQVEKRFVCMNGPLIWGMQTTTAVRDDTGAPRFIVNMIEDISASKFAEEQLRYLNSHDSMTGLRNRAWFDDEMGRLSLGLHIPTSIIIIDLDGLKRANDILGHDAGDSLIIGVATILREAFRGEDVAARIGGDEFGVLLPFTDEEAALGTLERIRGQQAGFNKARHELQVNFSVGIATARTNEQLSGIWKEADERMYVEKALHKRSSEVK